jgi:uncharacterized surface protein with fasciclin (FAS1) repeats
MTTRCVGFILVSIALMISGCSKDWEEHYDSARDIVDVKLWDTLQNMPDYSEYVKYIKKFKLDTIISSSNTKTLLVPGNEAFEKFFEGDTVGFAETMRYHIVPTLFMMRNVVENYRLQTLEKKYINITRRNNSYYVDDIEVLYSSPFFLDGKYYLIDSVLIPKPNLYQYLVRNIPSVRKYIDSRDSVVLDREKSKPIYFNEQGQTVYDSVVIITNLFEEEYFAISEEYANISATLVLPDQGSYAAALDEMAGKLGGQFNSHADIPVDWQHNELIPVLLNKGIYGGRLEPMDFNRKKVANIIGDSILIDFMIDPDSRYLCSNGLAYNYLSFSVGDSLYRNKKYEAEDFVEPIGLGKFVWNNKTVKLEGNTLFQPVEQRVSGASNDTIVNVQFSRGFNGSYAVTFKLKRVFPDRYRLVWRTNYRTSGIYSLYVNDQKVPLGLMGEEEVDTYGLSDGFFSVLGYKLYPDSKGFCSLDGWAMVDQYGDVAIKLEYRGPGNSNDNGLNIDFIQLLPE